MELVGGVLIVLGLFTRPVAFLLSGEMAFAYFMSHAPRGFYPIAMGGNGGETAILYCFTFLYFVFVGAGVWSLGEMRSPSGSAAVPRSSRRPRQRRHGALAARSRRIDAPPAGVDSPKEFR